MVLKLLNFEVGVMGRKHKIYFFQQHVTKPLMVHFACFFPPLCFPAQQLLQIRTLFLFRYKIICESDLLDVYINNHDNSDFLSGPASCAGIGQKFLRGI